MDELIQKITGKFDDISPEKAKEIVGTVADFLRDKLPGGMGDKVAGFLEGQDFDPGEMVDKAKGALGGLLGGDD
jgi:hypothetical protein